MMGELSKHITTSRGRRQLRIRKWRHKCYSRSTSSSTSLSYSSEPGQHKRKQVNLLFFLLNQLTVVILEILMIRNRELHPITDLTSSVQNIANLENTMTDSVNK